MIIPPMRGHDSHGKGYFGAPRGDHTHKGVDFVATAGDPVRAFMGGVVSKLGFPYADRPDFRYVEVRRANADCVRYFYVSPTVAVGDQINAGDMLGTSQQLPYEGIIQHYHLECIVKGEHCDPIRYLCDYAP